MNMRISQSEDQATGKTTLRVEGSLNRDGAELLEKLCARLLTHPNRSVVINLSGIRFLNEDGASVLRELKGREGVIFDGCHLFTQQVIEEATVS